MLLAEDFPVLARNALRGRWKQAAGVELLPCLMGAALSGSGVNIRFDKNDLSLANYFFKSNFWYRYMGVFIGDAVILAVYWVARLMIGGAVTLAEHPGMTASEAITASKEMMQGSKFRLFCLGFSFIGWALLCALPSFMLLFWISLNAYRLSIPVAILLVFLSFIPFWAGSVFFLTPYTEAAFAAFYRNVSRGSEQPSAEESAALPYEIILRCLSDRRNAGPFLCFKKIKNWGLTLPPVLAIIIKQS